MRKASVLLAIFATLMLSAFALSSPASADPNGPGNNGTVKVVDDKDDPIGADDRDNDPHVCKFHLYGFHFDKDSSGTWQIKSWAPTGNGSAVASGTWKTYRGTGEWAVPGPALGPGHYKLFAKQTVPATPGGDKQKVFWVECGSSTTGGTTGGSTGGTASGSTGGTTGGTETSGSSGAGTESNTTTGPNGITIFKSGNSGTSNGNGTAVRGFESGPNGNAVGAVSPIVELPGGSSQLSPNGAVNGVETSPVAGVQSLPSTSTAGAPSVPLTALGLAIIALGGALLRRKDMTV